MLPKGVKPWLQVPVVELLEVTVWDSDEFMNDSCLGVVEVDIAEDVAKVPGGRIYKTWYLQVRTHPGSLRAPIRAPASACQHASSCPLRMLPYMADLLEKPACCMLQMSALETSCGSSRERAGIARCMVSYEGYLQSGIYMQDVPKDQKTKHTPNANITLQIQWVPFDFTF